MKDIFTVTLETDILYRIEVKGSEAADPRRDARRTRS